MIIAAKKSFRNFKGKSWSIFCDFLNCQDEEGIGLVEVIFALGVSILVITSLVSLALFTLRSSLQSKLLLQGTKYANQELELVRAYRDTAPIWNSFIDDIRSCNSCSIDVAGMTVNAAPKCFSGGSVVSCGVSNADKVTVEFQARNTDGSVIGAGNYPDVIRVSVTTSWEVGGDSRAVYNNTEFSNWRSR